MWMTPQHFHTIPTSFAICHTTKLSNLNHNIPYRSSAAHSLYTASSNWEETVHTRLFKHSSKSFLMYTGYLYVQMIVQTPLSDSPKFIFNTVVPCIWLIFNPMSKAQYLTSLQRPIFAQSVQNVASYTTQWHKLLLLQNTSPLFVKNSSYFVSYEAAGCHWTQTEFRLAHDLRLQHITELIST